MYYEHHHDLYQSLVIFIYNLYYKFYIFINYYITLQLLKIEKKKLKFLINVCICNCWL